MSYVIIEIAFAVTRFAYAPMWGRGLAICFDVRESWTTLFISLAIIVRRRERYPLIMIVKNHATQYLPGVDFR